MSRDFCPRFQQAVELVGRRWCGAIARALLDGPLRVSELERAIPEISARALTQRLRELEAAGVVERVVEASSPVRVSYALSEKGRALEEVVTGLERWADDWVPAAV
jgi:DNA-binding HxlR family transcriptional regulator